jgi:ATP-binding cassette, subfamily B, bacterial
VAYCGGSSIAVDWDEEAMRIRHAPELRRRVIRYFFPYWRRGLLVFGLVLVGAVLGLVPAVVTKAILDYVSAPSGHFSRLALLIGAGVGASAVGGLLNVAQSYLEATISEGIMFTLRGQIFERLVGQSVGFFTETRTGEVMSRINNDVTGIEDVVSSTVFGMTYDAIIVPTTLAYMFFLNWRLALLIPLLIGPLIILPARYSGRKTFGARKQTQEQLGQISAYLQEVLGISGILLMKAFVRHRDERARFRRMNDELRQLEIREAMIGRWFYMIMETLQVVAPALLWLYGGYLVLHHQATIGTIVAFVVVLMGRLTNATTDLASLHVSVTGSLALFQRLFDLLDTPIAVANAPGAQTLTTCQGRVAFEGVTFAYRPGERPAVEDLWFEAKPGQLVALVGPTGAGKSTVTYLLSRSYDPQKGRVMVDGQDIRRFTLDSLSSHIGIVFQDTYLFHASIAENLRYAKPAASSRELEAAARAAYLHDFITSLPDGYDTIVGERGYRLSGGEKQRLAIARVILKNARILILDEATSHLDTVSEHLIQVALRPVLADRTSLVIAHRLSTILTADLILVLDQGRLVEQGTHAELVKQNGIYAGLYQRQFSAQGRQLPQLSSAPD